MRPRSLFLIVSAIFLTIACLVAGKAARQRHAAEASVAARLARRAALTAEIERMKSRSVAAEKVRSELAQNLEILRPRSPAGAATSDTPVGKPAQPRTMSEIIANDPKAEVLMLRWQRSVVLLEYGPFFRAQAMSPEQIKKFQDNWVKRTEQNIDLAAAARAQDEAGRQTVNQLQAQAKADYEASQIELLGAEGWRQLQEYDRTVVVRNIVVFGFAGAAALEGTPLTAQQGDQLWRAALTSASQDPKISGEQLVVTIDWEKLDTQARQILSPAQFAVFTTTAYPSGFSPRGKYQLDAVIRRALQADAANSAPPVTKPSGG
jgi:hypothetical protein